MSDEKEEWEVADEADGGDDGLEDWEVYDQEEQAAESGADENAAVADDSAIEAAETSEDTAIDNIAAAEDDLVASGDTVAGADAASMGADMGVSGGLDEAGSAAALTGSAIAGAKVAPLNELSEANSEALGLKQDLDVILDIPVKISMEVGSTELSIRNLIQLTQGSVIELDRLAGEPLDVMVNGTLIAQGEVVVVNEKFGIRITDVVSPSERLKKLR